MRHTRRPPVDWSAAPGGVRAHAPFWRGVTLDVHCQPIAAVRRGGVLGVEMLARGRSPSGAPMWPAELFGAAERDGTVAELDRACRRVAVERFAELRAGERGRAAPDLVGFVNCHVSTFLADVDGPDAWAALAAEWGVPPPLLALEVLESQAAELPELAAATARYRDAGFLVVIDDVGAGHSNLDRVAAIHPDLLKADRALVHGCAENRVQRAVLRALVGLSEELGGWVVAEGVERKEDALAALDVGVDLLQGYYLSRPAPIGAGVGAAAGRTEALAERYRERTRARVGRAREVQRERGEFARATAAALAPCPPEAWEEVLEGALARAPGDLAAASAAVLDPSGVQLTRTVRPAAAAAADRPERSAIFAPPGRGADHSHKEYVYLLGAEPGAHYESAPYVPLPNERVCVTVSTAFGAGEGRWLLCVHLDAQPQGPLDGGPPMDAFGR